MAAELAVVRDRLAAMDAGARSVAAAFATLAAAHLNKCIPITMPPGINSPGSIS